MRRDLNCIYDFVRENKMPLWIIHSLQQLYIDNIYTHKQSEHKIFIPFLL